MKRFTHLSAAALAAAVIAIGTASAVAAQETPVNAATSGAGIGAGVNSPALPDAVFVRQFTMANNTELAEARYVIRRTDNPVVRYFAQHMIDDHSTAAVKLSEAARELSPRVALGPNAMSPDQQLQFADLRSLDEPRLDAIYMRDQIADHNAAIALLDAETKNGTAPGLRAFASNARPIVLGHLGMVEAYQSSGGRSTEVSAAGVIYPGVMPGQPDAATARNGTPGNNPGVVSNGSTNGSGNGSGGTREGNTVANPNTPGAPANSAPQQNATPIPAASPR